MWYAVMMSTEMTPIQAMFAAQREALFQGQQAVQQGAAMQQEVNQALISALQAGLGLQRQTLETTQSMTHSFLDVYERSMPGGGPGFNAARESLDELVAVALDQHGEYAEVVENSAIEGVETANQLNDEFVDVVVQQYEQFIDAHQEFEAQSVEAFEAFTSQLDGLFYGPQNVEPQ